MLCDIKRAFSENKIAIMSAAAIFFISIILGYLLESFLHAYLNPVVDDLSQKVHTGVIRITFQSIFMNNIRIVLLMFIYGLILCFSAGILAFNGFFVGYYLAISDDLFKSLLLVMPHGIFEFSSCILACASGFVLFHFIYKFLKAIHRQDNGPVRVMLSKAFAESSLKLKQAIIILAIASVLMAVAGFVETYLTVPIAKFIYYL